MPDEENIVLEDILEVLDFELSNRDFAIDVDFVEMVIERPDITYVPKAPYFVKGVMNLRGRIVTVIDLSALLDIENNSDQSKILVLKVKDIEVGFLVNNVKEVIRITKESIDKPLNSEDVNKKTKGIIKYKNRLILYLDAEKIIEI
ncbi:MAG: purine-binding chemotaxis protein CheW [Thermotogaceae bacterium]|jgi:purine-binding chemotaxis protein CheW|nr:purine-binding chemotaxis protein CheW [Thermotogaceae bacterium]MDN5337089.1 purine-binding chemotaxis protein CheW [Thermotogaceae bacterium]